MESSQLINRKFFFLDSNDDFSFLFMTSCDSNFTFNVLAALSSQDLRVKYSVHLPSEN